MLENKLILNINGEVVKIKPDTLLIFFDETGTQSLNDPGAPFFGFGGLVVEARKYFSDVEIPWYKLKQDYFKGIDKPLHASDVGMNTNKDEHKKQISILNQFFTDYDFGRIAVTCTENSIFEIKQPVENIVASQIWDRIKEVANKMNWLDIHIFYEENPRLIPAFKKEIMAKSLFNKSGLKIDVRYSTLIKDPLFAGMEVADFIIHTAGRQARLMKDQHLEKDKIKKQPDFKVIFSPKAKQSWFSISKVA